MSKKRTVKMIYSPDSDEMISDGNAESEAMYLYEEFIAQGEDFYDPRYEVEYSTANVFEAVRCLIVEGIFDSDHFVFVYEDQELTIDRNGKVTPWRDGFINQTEKFARRIIAARRENRN